MMNEIKCENCKYYLPHFAKHGTRYVYLCNGHCINEELYKVRKKNKNALQKNCDYFEEDFDKIDREVESIENVICEIHKKLDMIEQMLIFLKEK